MFHVKHWFVVRGSWFVVRGSWFVVRGSWFVTRDPRPGGGRVETIGLWVELLGFQRRAWCPGDVRCVTGVTARFSSALGNNARCPLCHGCDTPGPCFLGDIWLIICDELGSAPDLPCSLGSLGVQRLWLPSRGQI